MHMYIHGHALCRVYILLPKILCGGTHSIVQPPLPVFIACLGVLPAGKGSFFSYKEIDSTPTCTS